MSKSIRVLASANAMKGSLSAKEASNMMASGAQKAISKFSEQFGQKFNGEFLIKPIADGGDDTVDVIADSFYINTIKGPLLDPVEARWGSLGDTAVIEMAKASGIALLPEDKLDPFTTTTFGTGQLILAAIEKGFKKILLTIGGSATVDGGIGALAAMGAQFYDKEDKIIEPYGNSALGKVARIDFSAFEKFKDVQFSIACDVDNILLGDKGSAAIFGPQKLRPSIRNDREAKMKAVSQMNANLENFANIIQKTTNKDIRMVKGIGAAGGLSIGFVAVFDALLRPGSEFILDMLGITDELHPDIVITSEGKCDVSTLNNKAPYALIRRFSNSYSIVLTGAIESEEVEQKLNDAGASIVMTIEDGAISLSDSMKRCGKLMERASYRAVYSYLRAHFK